MIDDQKSSGCVCLGLVSKLTPNVHISPRTTPAVRANILFWYFEGVVVDSSPFRKGAGGEPGLVRLLDGRPGPPSTKGGLCGACPAIWENFADHQPRLHIVRSITCSVRPVSVHLAWDGNPPTPLVTGIPAFTKIPPGDK